MSRKHALIVDDSKTAQVRLRKMLGRYNLEVDTANSAEDALSYLSYRQPAVIFMDHLMQGMDGFEALKIIKSNPHTAMIPIIMYTSKKGDVYLGQARALGAIDVLSKDVIEISSLDRVMSSIHVLPEKTGRHEAVNDAVSVEAAVKENKPSESGLDSVRKQIAHLMAMHSAELKHESMQSNRFLTKRLSKEIEELKGQLKKEQQKLQTNIQALGYQQRSSKWLLRWRWTILVLVGLLGLSFISFYKLHDSQKQQTIAQEQYQELSAFMKNNYSNLSKDNRRLYRSIVTNKNRVDSTTFYENLEWALNIDNQFDFTELALGEKQVTVISELLSRLNNVGFSGKILLDIHFGNFCATSNSNGEFTLPDSKQSFRNCDLLSNLVQDFSVEDQQSLAFINFMLSSPILRERKIQIEMQSYGISQPLFEYPQPSSVNSIDEWNEIAKLNNRLHISIVPTAQAQ